eukprot:CAMPEP_0178923478 /NCGR_PEP_ID=MMETSP0786-20121207/16739_1 /TAXON_ID=186022 /ORGANISM="Thalassionema frauenfeldii, Strain CCMP 1798" /LENGTH=615 /DNA_ID=CAMNT_0020597973 /DNA_START=52 /DNA_END=1896 /DNA_ORIENTATION=-
MSTKAKHAIVLLILCLLGLAIDFHVSKQNVRRLSIVDYVVPRNNRKVSIDLGGGDCEWTKAEKMDITKNPYGTLFASYPGAGMRLAWQMTEGATGINVGDDFFYSGKLGGLVKTQYPHPEGIWSYGKNMDQTILLIRNPRWNIPSYHTLLFELEYAHDYVVAYDNVFTAFSTRAPMENWIKWRDYRFEDEINLWGWYIDFWMEDGPQFWHSLDYERAGQYPFRYNRESEKPWPLDAHCRVDVTEGCVPQTVVSYERLKDPLQGPEELRRIADIIRYKKEMTMVSDEAIECIWNATWYNAPEPRNEDRDAGGTLADEYKFTIHHMEEMLAKIVLMKDKYSTGQWVMFKPARELVKNFHEYIKDISAELAEMYANPPPTQAPSIGYDKALVDWYNTLGRGNRHAKDIVQHMASYWGLVSDEFNTDPTPAPTACPEGYTGPDVTPTEQEWLDEHNLRRKNFYDLKNLTEANLKWSSELAASAQNYANKLAAQENGCWLQERLDGDEYGTQNMALNVGSATATPSQILEVWYDQQIDLVNMTLLGMKFHATQVIFRSSKYVGCGQATKTDAETGEQCHFHICRYLGPGNCFLEAFTDVYPTFHSLLPPNCMEEHPDNYW